MLQGTSEESESDVLNLSFYLDIELYAQAYAVADILDSDNMGLFLNVSHLYSQIVY